MIIYLVIFLVVFFTNTIPIFMPATWTVLAYIAIRYDVPIWYLTIIGAIAATLGRVTLAKLSRIIIRQQFLSDKIKKNIDDIKEHIETRPKTAIGLFLLYSFGPFPSSQLFIAYGLTNMKIKFLAIPFWIGRNVSYAAITFSADKLASRYTQGNLNGKFGWYFVSVQILTIASIYLFTKINWHNLFTKKQITLIK